MNSNFSSRLSLTLGAVLAFGVSVSAHSPARFMEVLEGDFSSKVDHAVDAKSILDTNADEVKLKGPSYFSRGVAVRTYFGKASSAYLGWYAIDRPTKPNRKTLRILDPLRGSSGEKLDLLAAEYLLCPTQVIASGPPAEIPHGLDFYKAYKVDGAESIKLKVAIGEDESKKQHLVGKPIFVCVATEHWHHDDHNKASHPDQCYVVYEIDGMEQDESINTLDQFGLNQLKVKSRKWLCVGGKVLDNK